MELNLLYFSSKPVQRQVHNIFDIVLHVVDDFIFGVAWGSCLLANSHRIYVIHISYDLNYEQ